MGFNRGTTVVRRQEPDESRLVTDDACYARTADVLNGQSDGRMANRQHGARSVAHDVFGYAAHKQVPESAATVPSHRDEIDIVCSRVPKDLDGWYSPFDGHSHTQAHVIFGGKQLL